ncbi:MAG: hypothetical protein A2Z88_07525 [Omnitrophica WOR_2 bacterium GWA2_47_8]|nr:MAG: hypothetical protein A2Z88_07525 [Omnitrophica WOR_2 bacterium GWA2_47_8]
MINDEPVRHNSWRKEKCGGLKMFKSFLKIFFGFILLTAMTGCSYKLKAYSQVRDRVDIDMPGSRGYAATGESATAKKTRRVYVVEFVKEPQEEKNPAPKAASSVKQDGLNYQTVESVPHFDVVDEEKGATAAQERPSYPVVDGYVQYTVEKDDTLQGISKKFYDNYSSWTKIYDANKEKIENPNVLRPGTVIRIPQEK